VYCWPRLCKRYLLIDSNWQKNASTPLESYISLLIRELVNQIAKVSNHFIVVSQKRI